MITLKFQVPEGNGYTKPTIQGRVIPHLKDLGHDWILLDSEQGRNFEIQTNKQLSQVQLNVAKTVLERHYGFKVSEVMTTYE